jgi:small subunit ribosomal protein S17
MPEQEEELPVTGVPEADVVAEVTADDLNADVVAEVTADDVKGEDLKAEGRANRRKVREGLVVSVKMDQTAVIGVVDRVRHPRYAKTVQRTKRLYAHDADNDLRVGDRVRVVETRPLSKLKRWRVVEVLERAK